MARKPEPIDWPLVERLCRRSFTGIGLSGEEQAYMERAYQQDPAQYRERTAAIREEERALLKRL